MNSPENKTTFEKIAIWYIKYKIIIAIMSIILFILVASLFLVFAGIGNIKNIENTKDWLKVIATVDDPDCTTGSKTITCDSEISFIVQGVKTDAIISEVVSKKYALGQQLNIIYNPTNTKEVQVTDTLKNNPTAGYAMLVSGIILFILLIIGMIFGYKKLNKNK
jgi:uncharacterized membrane protein